MTDSNQSAESILTFEDSRYAIADLSDDAKKLIAGLRVSDAQIKFQQDNLRLLAIAKAGLAQQLKIAIKDVSPLSD